MAKKPKGYWNYERCLDSARPYDSLSSWSSSKEGRDSYVAAVDRKIQRDIGKELGWAITDAKKRYTEKPTLEEAIKQTSGYISRADLSRKDSQLHYYIKNKGWLDSVADAHGWSTRKFTFRTYEECKAIGASYGGLLPWKRGDPNSYRVAVTNSWQVQISMELGWPVAPQSKQARLAALEKANQLCSQVETSENLISGKN